MTDAEWFEPGLNYNAHGAIMDGEYSVHVHKASDEKIFCSLRQDGSEAQFPDDIEEIERLCFLKERDEDLEFEELLETEAERESEPPYVGTVEYEKGKLVNHNFTMEAFK